ncbi:hypothetical protein, conserved [Eimeria praecox]|uniref:Uncharacterized protein n=1 Tax=Eimeria praecox TaxID=51316 RepID=U6G8J7_9EIME|nr:hypothetical protein, conserved [Eimeria praecox]
MRPSSRSTRNPSALPPNTSPVPLPNAQSNRNSSNNNGGQVPQLDLAHAAEVAAARQGAPWAQGVLASAMDTTRSQQCANCSDCMLPCRVFLGLSAPQALKLPAPKRSASKQTSGPSRPVGPEAAVAPRSGRSVSSGQLAGRTVSSLQSQPGLNSGVPIFVPSTAGPRVPERGRVQDRQGTAASTAQISSFLQAQQTQPSSQYPLIRASVPLNRPGEGPIVASAYRGQLPTPVVATAQSVQGAASSGQYPTYMIPVPSAGSSAETGTGGGAAGRAAASAQPTTSYASFAAQNNGGGQVTCFVGPNGEIYVRPNAGSSTGNATPVSEQRRINACSSPSSAGRSLSGSISRSPVPVLVVQGRSQSVAPPVPRVQRGPVSKPVETRDETGMATEKARAAGKAADGILENQLPIELDPSLRDVLDGQMLSSRSRLLAMELKAAREHCKSIQEGFKEETKQLKEENERLLSIVESIQKRIEDLQFQLSASKKEPSGGDADVNVCSELRSGIRDSRESPTLQKKPNEQAKTPLEDSPLKRPMTGTTRDGPALAADGFEERPRAKSTQYNGLQQLGSPTNEQRETTDSNRLQQQHSWTNLTATKAPTALAGKAPPEPTSSGKPMVQPIPGTVTPQAHSPSEQQPTQHQPEQMREEAFPATRRAQETISSPMDAKEAKAPVPKAGPGLFEKPSQSVLPKKAVEAAPKADGAPAAKAAEGESAAKELPKKAPGALPKKAVEAAPKADGAPAAKAAEGESATKEEGGGGRA